MWHDLPWSLGPTLVSLDVGTKLAHDLFCLQLCIAPKTVRVHSWICTDVLDEASFDPIKLTEVKPRIVAGRKAHGETKYTVYMEEHMRHDHDLPTEIRGFLSGLSRSVTTSSLSEAADAAARHESQVVHAINRLEACLGNGAAETNRLVSSKTD